MPGPQKLMPVSIRMHCIIIEIAHPCIRENIHVISVFCLVAEHGLDLQGSTVIIALPVSAEGTAKQVVINVDRLLLTLSHRDIDHHDGITVQFIDFDILFAQKIDADFGTVIDRIPEVFLQPGWIFQASRIP